MPKKAKRKTRKRGATKGQVAPTRQQQFLPIHNSALANSVRDSKIGESIRVRLKEDDTLSATQIEDLQERRKELLKV